MHYEFRYLAPRTQAELVAILDDHRDDGRILAGGTDLIPGIRNGVARPGFVIDIKKVDKAQELRFEPGTGLSIGPAATVNDVLRSAEARERYPLLCECAHELASHQVRNRATVVGNLTNASPCSDMAPALLCLGAEVEIRSRGGERVVPLSAFFIGVKKTVLKPGEFVSRVRVPAESAGATGGYMKLKRIAGHDLGIVGVLMARLGDRLLFAVSSAAPTPVLVAGASPSDGPDDVVARVLAGVSPISDVRGTKEYRLHMIDVFTRRLLSGQGAHGAAEGGRGRAL